MNLDKKRPEVEELDYVDPTEEKTDSKTNSPVKNDQAKLPSPNEEKKSEFY